MVNSFSIILKCLKISFKQIYRLELFEGIHFFYYKNRLKRVTPLFCVVLYDMNNGSLMFKDLSYFIVPMVYTFFFIYVVVHLINFTTIYNNICTFGGNGRDIIDEYVTNHFGKDISQNKLVVGFSFYLTMVISILLLIFNIIMLLLFTCWSFYTLDMWIGKLTGSLDGIFMSDLRPWVDCIIKPLYFYVCALLLFLPKSFRISTIEKGKLEFLLTSNRKLINGDISFSKGEISLETFENIKLSVANDENYYLTHFDNAIKLAEWFSFF